MTDIVKLYNPANAATLSPQELAEMQSLTSAQIKELSLAYPNGMFNRNYLLIIDSGKQIEKQLPSLSSWGSLYNLREKNGQRKWVAYGFVGSKQPRVIIQQSKVNRTKMQVVDLADAELMSLPGFKTSNSQIPATQVPVKKINKQTSVTPTKTPL
jgi:hypothetical protein